MRKFCIFCKASTKDFFICQNCFNDKQKNFEANLKNLDIKDKKLILNFLKFARYSELLAFLAVVTAILAAFVIISPYIWRATAQWNQQLRIIIVNFFYLFNFLGLYFGIRVYQRVERDISLLSTSGFRIFEQNYSRSRVKLIIDATLFRLMRNFILFLKFWPLTLLVAYILFFTNFLSVILEIFRLHPFVEVNIALWTYSFVTNFWIGLILLGPSLLNFLYTDWLNSFLDRTRRF